MSARIKKRFLLCLLLSGSLLLLSGCRTRNTSAAKPSENAVSGAMEAAADAGLAYDGAMISDGFTAPENTSDSDLAGQEGDSRNTAENPERSNREYDESADADILPGKAQRLHAPGEGEGFFDYAPDALSASVRTDDTAERTATRTEWVNASRRMSTGDAGETADSALQFYTVLLDERTSSLFECKKLYAYLEMPQEYVTIHKSGDAHRLLLSAGLYDVSSRLQEDGLTVTGGWVVRKNPDLIVKLTASDVLGLKVSTADQAEPIYSGLFLRDEWDKMEAVHEHRVLLMSEEVLGNPYLACAGALMLAKTAYPELFNDVDMTDALARLLDESGGCSFPGTLFYTK